MERHKLEPADIDRIIEMAWEDRTPFDAIFNQFGLSEADVVRLMQKEMKRSSWIMWRKRMNGRSTKHAALRDDSVNRFACSRQRQISNNKVSKR